MYKIACVTNRTEKVATIRRLQFPLLIVLRPRLSPPLSSLTIRSLFSLATLALRLEPVPVSVEGRERAHEVVARAPKDQLIWTGQVLRSQQQSEK